MRFDSPEPHEIAADAGAGVKVPLHFGLPSRPLFGFYHPAAPRQDRDRDRDRRAGVVLCSPVGTDQTRSERTYRHLAEALAEAGFACLRFDPFGTGDSGGDERTPGLARAWIDDIGVAIAEVRARAGVARVSLVGLRLGATLAMAHAAESGDVGSLVLWSPCVSGAAYVAEVGRLHKVYARIEPQVAAAAPPADDGVEALGMFLPRALVDDLSRVDLLAIGRKPAQRTLFVDGGNVQGRDALVARIRELGGACDVRAHLGHKFLLTVSHRSLLPAEVIASIVSWLRDDPAGDPPSAPRDAASRAPLPAPQAPEATGATGVTGATRAPHGERFVVLRGQNGQRPLFGILTPAEARAASTSHPARPPILLTNAGCVNRSGPHRTYTKMARRWAALGFDVLRIDLSGIGDSPVGPGAEENLTYPPSGLDDLDRAIRGLQDWQGSQGLQAGRPERIILAGLCSGGDYAFQLGARDERIAGALILNPRTFCVLDLAAVETADGAPPKTPVADVPRMLAAMANRGVETLLVVGRGDPGVTYVDAHAGDAMRALGGGGHGGENAPRFRRVDVEGTDHTFTPVTAQDGLSSLLTEHLLAKHSFPQDKDRL